jgi:anti-sigma regulatory factor (Ser/Thr protein kinase)
LDGDIQQLGRIAAAVEEFCDDHTLGSDTGFQLNLVLEELFVNAIRHGGCTGMENAVRIQLRAGSSGEVYVVFADRGAPFDLTAAPQANTGAPLAERPDGGLGIHLVRKIMRDISYKREDGWNLLAMQQPVPERQETL